MTILEIIHALRDKVKKRLPISIILSLIIAAGVGLYFSSIPGEYSATARIFPLSANSSRGASSPLDQIRSQFGIGGGEGSNEIYDLNELIISKRLSFKVVNSITTNKKFDKLYKWLVFDHNSELRFYEDKIVLGDKKTDSLKNLIVGRSLLLGRVEVEKSDNGYTSLIVKSYDKELAKEINENILIALSEFYIDFVTEKPRTDLIQIQKMRDSLSTELSLIERAIAGQIDNSQFGVKASVNLPRAKLQRKQTEVQAIYSTTVNALQNARFKLLSESPIFQILDYPGEPFSYYKEPWKKTAVIAFLLCMILFSLWFCRKIFINIIVEELKKA